MKIKLKTLLLIPLLALLLFTSCQDEVLEVTPPDETEILVADSILTSLISATSIMDGSADNIIDNASCLSVELPVTVIVRGLEITVDSREDFKVIEAIFKELDDDEDTLDIVFPITIILTNHDEVVLQNREALDELINECRGENEEDDDIECIDFQYPLSFSVYNTDFQVINTITIESDRELYKFIKRVRSAEVFASLNFPVTMALANGTEIVVNNNTELQRTIEEAKDTCDEDDDNDYGDDDFTKERLDAYLKTCPWVVYEFERDNEDKTDFYKEYALNFKENNVVVMRTREGTRLFGTWSTSETDRGALLKLEFNKLTDFTLEWVVYDIEDGKIKLFEDGDNRIMAKSNCDRSTDNDLEDKLTKCVWNFTDSRDTWLGVVTFKFLENGETKRVTKNGTLVNAGNYSTWKLENGILYFKDENGQPNPEEWHIVSSEEGKFDIEIYVAGILEYKSVLKSNCDGSTDNDLEDKLTKCAWNFTDSRDTWLGVVTFKFLENGEVKGVTKNGTLVNGANYRTWKLENSILYFKDENGQPNPEEWHIVSSEEDRFDIEIYEAGKLEYKSVLKRDCDI